MRRTNRQNIVCFPQFTFYVIFSLVIFCLIDNTIEQSTKVRATNGVSDSTTVFFCLQSTNPSGDSSNDVTDLSLDYGDVSPYFFLNISTTWDIGVYTLPSCNNDSLLAFTSVTVNPSYTYTFSFVGAIANETESLVVYNYTSPAAASAGACKINLYFQAENTTDVNLALFLPGTFASVFSIVEDDLYAATGYQVSDNVGFLDGNLIYQFYDSRYSITGVSLQFNYTFVERKSYSVFAWGVLDHFDFDSLKVVVVLDDDSDDEYYEQTASLQSVSDGGDDGNDEWIWITSTVILAIVTISFFFVLVVMVVFYLRNRKLQNYSQY